MHQTTGMPFSNKTLKVAVHGAQFPPGQWAHPL